MFDFVAFPPQGAKEKTEMSSSDEFLHNSVTSFVILTAIMGFFVKKPTKKVERQASNIFNAVRKESAMNKPAAVQDPTTSVVTPLKTHIHENSQEYKASHLESQSAQPVQVRSGILDAINKSSNMLNASSAAVHLRVLGLPEKDHTAVEIVEAYKRKAMQCNPEIFDLNDPKRRSSEAEFAVVRDSFRMLMKYKEQVSKSKEVKG